MTRIWINKFAFNESVRRKEKQPDLFVVESDGEIGYKDQIDGKGWKFGWDFTRQPSLWIELIEEKSVEQQTSLSPTLS